MFQPLIFSLYGTLNRNIYAKIWPVLLIETVRLGVKMLWGIWNQYTKNENQYKNLKYMFCSLLFFLYILKRSQQYCSQTPKEFS